MRIRPVIYSMSLLVLTCTACGGKEKFTPGSPTLAAPAGTSEAQPPVASAPVQTAIDSMDLPFHIVSASQGFSVLRVNQSTGEPGLKIGGESFAKGIGTHAPSRIEIQLPDGAKKLSGGCGLDAFATAPGNVTCRIEAGGKVLWDSGIVAGSKDVARFSVGVEGISQLTLIVDPNGSMDFDHTDWVDLKVE